jgi:serine/threonine protein kinase
MDDNLPSQSFLSEIKDTILIPQIYEGDIVECFKKNIADTTEKCDLQTWLSLPKNILGVGADAQVELGEGKKCKKMYAIKITKIKNKDTVLRIKNEWTLFIHFKNSPYFPKVFDYFVCSTPKSVILIMEVLYMTLREYINENNQMSYTWWKKILKQVIEAYTVLEKIGVSHNDAHIDNIMLKSKDDIINNPQICLIDFTRMSSYKDFKIETLSQPSRNSGIDGKDLYYFCDYIIHLPERNLIPEKLLQFCKIITKWYKEENEYITATEIFNRITSL